MLTISTPLLASRLRVALARGARRLRQEVGNDLSPTMSAGLATISRHGRLTPSELASREWIQRPTATRLIARLEEQGLVERMADPDDGRSLFIATTPAGEAKLERSRTQRDVFLTQRLDRLGHEDRATLARATEILERLFADERT